MVGKATFGKSEFGSAVYPLVHVPDDVRYSRVVLPSLATNPQAELESAEIHIKVYVA